MKINLKMIHFQKIALKSKHITRSKDDEQNILKENIRDYSHTFGKEQRNYGNQNFAKNNFIFSDVDKSQNLEFNNNIIEETNNSKILSNKKFDQQEISKQYFLGNNLDGNSQLQNSQRIKKIPNQVEEEFQIIKKQNERLVKENNLFKEEFKVLMGTIKNLQNEVVKNKSAKETAVDSKSVYIAPKENLTEMTKSRQLKRKFEFVNQENERLKSMNQTMKNISQNDFSKVVEANTYYKMLNQELQEYIKSLKGDLTRETSKSVNLESKINKMHKEGNNIRKMIGDFKMEMETLQIPPIFEFNNKTSLQNNNSTSGFRGSADSV